MEKQTYIRFCRLNHVEPPGEKENSISYTKHLLANYRKFRDSFDNEDIVIDHLSRVMHQYEEKDKSHLQTLLLLAKEDENIEKEIFLCRCMAQIDTALAKLKEKDADSRRSVSLYDMIYIRFLDAEYKKVTTVCSILGISEPLYYRYARLSEQYITELLWG